MPRWLPILLVQQPSPDDPTVTGPFERSLRLSLELFPESQLVVYPEMHLCPLAYGPPELQAEPLDGKRVSWLRELASDLRIWLIPGTIFERGDDGRIYNTAVVISPSGDLVATYNKCFPWRPRETVSPGRSFTVFDIDGIGRVGLSICYDSWFPEVARQLAWMGAEVIVQPTLTTTSDRPQEIILNRAAAIANQVFVVSVNAASPLGVGQSLVAGPEGEVLYQAGEAPLMITQVLDLDQVTRVRKHGTAGLNKVWSQFLESDAPLALPAYEGRIDPRDWQPRVRS